MILLGTRTPRLQLVSALRRDGGGAYGSPSSPETPGKQLAENEAGRPSLSGSSWCLLGSGV